MSNLTNRTRTWLITGCSSGFGASLARAALEAGDKVVATARRAEDLDSLSVIPGASVLALDVTDAAQVQGALRQAMDEHGSLDVIVNNAGAGLLGALEDCSRDEVEACMAVNFYGPLAVMQAAAPILRSQTGGHMINISAAAAIANYPGFSIYGAAKAALEAASESYRAELNAFGVKVTLVQPGPFRTQFIGRSMRRASAANSAYEKTVGQFGALLGRMDGRQPGDPDKAAAAIVRMVQEGRAPMRLVLGAYAQRKARDTAAARLRELDDFAQYGSGLEFTS